MQTDEALAAEQAVAEKLAAAGVDHVRRHSFSEPQAAPAETGTPAEEPTGRPRDEQGRFTSTQPEPETAVEETTPEPTDVQPAATDQQDPAVAAYLQKYGGDTTKALQAAVAAQRKLGEMGSEVGEQRKIIAELEQLQQQVQQMQQPQPAQMVPDQATVDWIDEQIMTNPATAQQFAVQALQANQPLLYDRIMESWFQVQPRAASRFENALAVEQAKQEMRASAPAVQNDAAEMQNALTNVLAQHPEFNQYADQIDTAIERYPVVAAGLRGSQQEKQNAIETLFALAERDTLRALAFAGATPAAETTQADVVTQTTSEHNPAEPEPEPSAQDVFREQFRQAARAYTGDRVVPGAYVAR